MEKIKGLIKDNKQTIIICTGMLVFVIVLISFIVFFKKENARRKTFVVKVQDLYADIINQYNAGVAKGEKITFFSNAINGIRFQKDKLRYCAIFDDNGSITSIEATDGRYFIKTDNPDESSKIRWGTYEEFQCSKILPTLAPSGYDKKANVRANIFGGNIEEYRIEKIEFMPSNAVPKDVLGSYDASARKDGSVMAWYEDKDKNDMYELYIGGNGGVIANEDSSYMFAGIYNLVELNLKYLDTSNVTDMEGMFYYLSNLKELDITNLITSNVTNMSKMFYYVIGVKDLDLRTFDTSNVTNMSGMFEGCWSVEKLNLVSFNTKKVKNMNAMFESCSKLIDVDLSFDTSNVEDSSLMFSGCYLLTDNNLKDFKIPKTDNVKYMFCSTQFNEESEVSKSYKGNNIKDLFECK